MRTKDLRIGETYACQWRRHGAVVPVVVEATNVNTGYKRGLVAVKVGGHFNFTTMPPAKLVATWAEYESRQQELATAQALEDAEHEATMQARTRKAVRLDDVLMSAGAPGGKVYPMWSATVSRLVAAGLVGGTDDDGTYVISRIPNIDEVIEDGNAPAIPIDTLLLVVK